MTSIQIWLSETDKSKAERELQRSVWDELGWEPYIDREAIRLDVRDSVASLHGTVESFPQKLAAERAVQRVPGISAVVNDITIALPAGDERDDAALNRAAAQALKGDVLVPRGRITTRAGGGVVTLEGSVALDYQRAAAVEAITRLRGVRGVTNLVTLERRPVAAEAIRSRVAAAFGREAQLHGRHIRIEARPDAVVLEGHVRSLAERARADELAQGVPGVTRVQNELTIER